MSQPDTEEALRNRVETLENENERLREENEQLREQGEESTTTRRQLLRASAIAGASAITLTAATGSASAQSAVFPANTDPALEKMRANIINYQSVSSGEAPSNQSTSEVVAYVLDGDLP